MANVQMYPLPHESSPRIQLGETNLFNRLTHSRAVRRTAGITAVTAFAGLVFGSAYFIRRPHDERPDRPSGIAPAVVPSGEISSSEHKGAVNRPEYDDYGGVRCAGMKVTRPSATSLHIEVATENDRRSSSSRYATVVDVLHGSSAGEHGKNLRTYVARGLGASITVEVSANMNWREDSAYVGIAYFPPGTSIPTTPDGFSPLKENAGNVLNSTCGNAVMDWQTANGGITVPGIGNVTK